MKFLVLGLAVTGLLITALLGNRRDQLELSELLPSLKRAATKRVSAAIALQDIGSAASAAIPHLRQPLTDDDAEVRIAAQETLRAIGTE